MCCHGNGKFLYSRNVFVLGKINLIVDTHVFFFLNQSKLSYVWQNELLLNLYINNVCMHYQIIANI